MTPPETLWLWLCESGELEKRWKIWKRFIRADTYHKMIVINASLRFVNNLLPKFSSSQPLIHGPVKRLCFYEILDISLKLCIKNQSTILIISSMFECGVYVQCRNAQYCVVLKLNNRHNYSHWTFLIKNRVEGLLYTNARLPLRVTLKRLNYNFRGYGWVFFLSIVFPHLLQIILDMKVTIAWHTDCKRKSKIKLHISAVLLVELWYFIV
jgi:hypothetical protein